MKSFEEFVEHASTTINEEIEVLTEMPHIMFDSGHAVDLELEVHSDMRPKEYINYYVDWLEGNTISSKHPNHSYKLIGKREKKEFAEHILNSPHIKMFTEKHYGPKIWKKLVAKVKKYV